MGTDFQEEIRGVLGIPGWEVKKGVGSFLTFEFGEPRLKITEPHIKLSAKHKVAGGAAVSFPRRRVFLLGEWHLWIQYCHWDIFMSGLKLAHSESPNDEIHQATKLLNGQKITQIHFCESTGNTVFRFDLGGVLQTTRYEEEDEGWPYAETVHWMLARPDRGHVSVYADGKWNVWFGAPE